MFAALALAAVLHSAPTADSPPCDASVGVVTDCAQMQLPEETIGRAYDPVVEAPAPTSVAVPSAAPATAPTHAAPSTQRTAPKPAPAVTVTVVPATSPAPVAAQSWRGEDVSDFLIFFFERVSHSFHV